MRLADRKAFLQVKTRLAISLAVLALASSMMAQCVPEGDSAKREVFSGVSDLPSLGGRLAGPELSLEEYGTNVLATLRDYEGTADPLETDLKGKLTGCGLNLTGRNRRGKVEVRGTIEIASFKGNIVRQIGTHIYSELVVLKRKLPDHIPRVWVSGQPRIIGFGSRSPALPI